MITTTFVLAAIEISQVSTGMIQELIERGCSWGTFEKTTLVGTVVRSIDEEGVSIENAQEIPLDHALCETLRDEIQRLTADAGVQAHAYVARWAWDLDDSLAEEPTTLVGITERVVQHG